MRKMIMGFFLAALTAGNVFALSSESALIDQYTKKATAELVDYNDGTLMNVYYVGSGTQAAVEVASGSLTTYVPIGTQDLSYDLAQTAYDTLGELCDALEAEDDYECDLTGGKRDDSSLLLDFVTAATTTDAKTAGGYSITIDTAGVTETDPYIMRVGITPRSGKRVVLKGCRVQTDGTGTLVIYGKLAKYTGVDSPTRNDTTQVWSEPTANDTAESVPSSVIEGGWLEFGDDEHVVISAGNSTTAQTATSFLECYWDEK